MAQRLYTLFAHHSTRQAPSKCCCCIGPPGFLYGHAHTWVRELAIDIRNPSPGLYNEDLAPTKDRRWGAFSIFNVWTSDVHSLWGYYLAASLFLLCGNFVNFVLAIGPGRWSSTG